MTRSSFTLLLACCLALVCRGTLAEDQAGDSGAAASPEQEQFFEKQIRPLLSEHCFKCHGPKKQEYGLRLDSRQTILAGGDSGEKIVNAENPAASLLLEVVRYEGDIQMPPDGKLPDADIEALARWVEMGLPWPKGDAEAPRILSFDEHVAEARKSHWSYQPVGQTARSKGLRDGAHTAIDAYALATLAKHGLTMNPPADRRTLIRRATIDLWGLPPAPEAVDTFVADSAPDAYERLIDRLLASPRYGERWGRHWLDVARYADTRGYSFGRERRFPYAYTYRDYVIAALNDDLPYDRFIVEQLAADRLALGDDKRPLAALGFLTVGRRFNNEHDDIDDQIDVVSRGLLGLTVACARCHDHKYDAISMEDYYSLYGVFASTSEPKEMPLLGEPRDTAAYRQFKEKQAELRSKLDEFSDQKLEEIKHEARQRVTEYMVRAVSKQPEELLQKLPFISLSEGELRPRLVQRWREHLAQQAADEHPVYQPLRVAADAPAEQCAQRMEQYIATLGGDGPNRLNPLIADALRSEPPTSIAEAAHVVGAVFERIYAQWKEAGGNSSKLPDEARQIAELLLGDDAPTDISQRELRRYLNRADRNEQSELQKKIDSHQVNSPGAPPRAMAVEDQEKPHDPRVFLRGNHARRGKAVPRQFLEVLAGPERQPFADGSGRRELAAAIVDPANPLTRRVIANRVWMHHFGQPLVETPSDFGERAELPQNSGLLDYLARRLEESGWSLKSLHREIMLSAAYRQSSDLHAEGQQVDPENRLLWRMNRRRLEFEPLRDALLLVGGRLDESMGGKPVEMTEAPFSRRRAVYGFIDRQDLPNLLRAFDFASPDQSSAKRPRTTVPQQALFLMNSPFVIEQAQALAARVAGDGHERQRIAALYRVLFARQPTAEEIAVGHEFVAAASSAEPSAAGLNGWEQYAQLLLLTNEFMYID